MTEAAQEVLRQHVQWVETHRQGWFARRSAMEDDFWQGESRNGGGSRLRVEGDGFALAGQPGTGFHHLTQVNLIRPWVTSFVASLYYRGVRVSIEPDAIPSEEASQEVRAEKARGMQAVANRFLATSQAEDVLERMFVMGLCYGGGCAPRLCLAAEERRPKKQEVLDLIGIEAVPPWGCVWDRRTQSRDRLRYIGALYQMPKEDAEAIFGAKVLAKDEEIAGPLMDVLANGFSGVPDPMAQKDHVWIFELLDYMTPTTTDGKTLPGTFAIYLVTGLGIENGLVELRKGAPPYAWADDRPAASLIPFLPEPFPEFPLDSMAGAQSVYELNAELNRALTVVAEAFRRDAARVILYLRDRGVSEEALAQIVSGQDLILVGLDTQVLEGLFKILEMPPISSTLLEYIRQLQNGIDRTQLLADVTRGKAGEYLSATEAANLVNYSETTIGRVRKRADDVIESLVATYFRHLDGAMEEMRLDEIEILVNGKPVTLDREDLALRWQIQAIDTVSTPAAAAQTRTEFMAALPSLMQLATAADPSGAASAALAARALDQMVELLKLPAAFRAEALMPAGPAQPGQPAPEQSPSSGGPAGIPATDVEALLRSPAAQAILNAAEAEGGAPA